MGKKERVFKYTRFSRFASKEGITDRELLEVVDQLEADQADANLGRPIMHGKAVWMNKLYTTWRTINFNITNNARRL